MEFSKIKFRANEGVELTLKLKLDGGVTETREFTCQQPPLPELPAALQAFKPFVLTLLPLRDEVILDEEGKEMERLLDKLLITTLSIDEEPKTKRVGLIVTSVLPIDQANGRPLVLNTPRMREWEDDGSEQPAGTFGEDVAKLIEAAQDAASAYYRGERGQAEMFTPEQTTATPDEKTNGSDPTAPPKVRRRRPRPIVPEVGEVVNADATLPPTDSVIRKQLQISGLDVPESAIATWTSSEREEAMRYAQAPDGVATPEFIRDAASLDAWTDQNPPRIGDNAKQEIMASVEAAD